MILFFIMWKIVFYFRNSGTGMVPSANEIWLYFPTSRFPITTSDVKSLAYKKPISPPPRTTPNPHSTYPLSPHPKTFQIDQSRGSFGGFFWSMGVRENWPGNLERLGKWRCDIRTVSHTLLCSQVSSHVTASINSWPLFVLTWLASLYH